MKKESDLRTLFRRLVNSYAAPLGCGLFFLFLLRFVFFFGYVPSASMEPTIKEGSFIFGVRLLRELELGDVIVFEHDGSLLTKRIAALPGDSIIMDGKTIIVPENSYFMLGDNADMSIDSRFWVEPFVEQSTIVALLTFR